MNKEYRIRAYFSEVYAPRSFKCKVYTTLEEAETALIKAKEYYNKYPYLIKVVIESRQITEWSEENE